MPRPDPSATEELEIDLLLEGLFRQYGFDFRGYARSSLRRRVRAVLAAEQLGTVSALQERVLRDSDCLGRLLLGLSVNVSEMFRDPRFFLTFRRHAVPLLRTYPFIRIWQAGCSTGQEVYSLAILLLEEGLFERCRIYATDMNESVLQQARDGIYSAELMQKYTANYLASGGSREFSSYYTAAYDHVIFRPSLRERVVFAQHNLASDGPFNEFNVILCRNVMIYFARALQDQVHLLFARSLARFGLLGLGSHESIRFAPTEHQYEPVEPGEKLFQARALMAYECVVIGASLGGLEAVAMLLKSLGPDFAAPIAIAQHRAAGYADGDLSAIWQRSTSLSIRDAEDKEGIERRRIYVAPADYHLLIESPDQVALSTDPPVLYARPSIDVLFESAAEVFADKLIGVILTGASADGSQGLKAVRKRGGCAIVQDPATAECAVMPRSAIAAISVNYVLPLPDLGRNADGAHGGFRSRGCTVSDVRILIVDDYPENLLALEAILGGAGYSVVRANSGREALKALLAHDFALILMDVAMPDLNGYETAVLIRGRERSRLTPIIFLTAINKAEAQVFEGYSAGAVDYLFKPFVPEMLLSKVSIFVELYTNRERLKQQAAALKGAYEEMEQRVVERTSELAASNRALQTEVVERRRAEDERAVLFEREQAARFEAETMNRMKDEFLATLSHELRTPLNAILGWTHLLESGKRDEASINRATRVIKNNVNAQAQIVADILDVSRIIGGKLRLDIREVDLRSVVDTTIETLQPAAEAKNITVELIWALNVKLLADEDRLRQVMWNLLSNAIKFTPKGGHVRVEVQSMEHEVVIVVADNGEGIGAEFLPHVFDRFTQADSSFARPHTGLGLGMAIVRHLLELHGGGVSVESPGKNLGATFTITLPIRAVSTQVGAAQREQRLAARDVSDDVLPSLDGISVLIVDDEPEAREVLMLLLQERGAEVTAVDSAAAAFRILRRRVPDVLVSDVGMPGQDGLEFIRRVRALGINRAARVPAVALTAYATASDIAQALAAGFNRHLTKPIVISEIVQVIASLVDHRSSPDIAV